ncbi:MAG: ComF family protein [Ideonella sp.]
MRDALRLPVLPSQCGICHGWGWSMLCDCCIDRFAQRRPRCRRCALPVPDTVEVCGRCLIAPPSYDLAIAALDYAAPWDGLIARFKFHSALDLCAALAERLLEAAQAAKLPPPGLIVPTPLSPRRLRERGYNQAWELARRLARRLGCAASPDLLLRVEDRPPQLSLPREERLANVRNAFAVDPLRRGELQGCDVTVVDDVMTTGATAEEITGVLRRAGVARVQIWTLARTPAPGE